MTEEPLVSVIATSYDLERLSDLTALLESLAQQTYHRFETMLVLEKSRELMDKISELVRARGYSNVHLLFNSGAGGLSAARNLGVRKACGELMSFIDDDAVATPGWLAGVVKTFRVNPDAVGVTGPILPLWENESLKWLPEEFYWIVSCMPAKSASAFEVRNAWGTNMSFSREAFETGGLFRCELGAKGGGQSGKHELIGEDTEFSLRARKTSGKRIVCAPDAIVYHRAYSYRFTRGFVASRAYWEGYTKVILHRSIGQQYRDALEVEHRLLKEILLKLLPSTLADLFTHPACAWKRLQLMGLALSSIAVGYIRGRLKPECTMLGVGTCPEYL